MTSTLKRALACSTSAAVLALCGTANAQAVSTPATAPAEASASTLQEVIVTAQRRSENLQNVPIAVTSFSATALAAQQITNTRDIARVVPGFLSNNNVGQASANVYFIRGLGQTQSFPTFEPQVGTYIDDIYIGRQNANNFTLFGVDSVQVLRGPQGTLFGRNSTGGAVVVTLQKPSSRFGGYVEVGGGSYGEFMARGSVDIPVGDQLRTRTSFFGSRNDGFVYDVTTHERLNNAENYGVREAITVLPAKFSNVQWNISADFADNNEANVLNQPAPRNYTGPTQDSDRIALTGASSFDNGPLARFLTGKKGRLGQGVDVKSWGGASNLQIKLDAGTLNIISGFRGLNQKLQVDFPFAGFGPQVPFDSVSPVGQYDLAQDFTGDEYTQEVKWNGDLLGGRLNYTAGAYYLYETDRDNFGAAGNIADVPLAVLGGASLFQLRGATYFPVPFGDEFTKNQTISEAGYLQGDFKITQALILTLGGRYTHEIKTVTARPNQPNAPTPLGFTTAAIIAAGYRTKLTTDQFTPRLALQYRFDPELMVFASATRGFQGGGWNGLAFNAPTFNNFGPETVWSYESGFRSETPDHRLRFNTTLFYSDVHNYQLLANAASAGATASFTTNNAADLAVYGAELEATWEPIQKLTLAANIGLLHASYYNQSAAVRMQQAACVASGGTSPTECLAGIVNRQGRLATPAETPPFKSSVNASYIFDFHNFTITPTGGVQYSARYNPGTEGATEGITHPYTLIDFGVTFQPHDAPWKLTAECQNCTTVDYSTSYLFGYRYYNYPGTWDVKLNYTF